MEGSRKSKKRITPRKNSQEITKQSQLLVNYVNNVIKESSDKFDKYLHINAVNVDNENHQLHCALINSRSVGNMVPHIIDLITENKLDFLIITGTWLCDDDIAKVSLIIPNGYTTFTKSRDGRKGGGVAVICRDQFRYSISENVNTSSSMF